MSYLIDEKDEAILAVLREHADFPVRKIAKKTLLPITTVHNRIRKLRSEGIIKKYTVELDHQKLGKKFCAIILVSADYQALRTIGKDQHELAKEMLRLAEVESVDIVTGGTDLVVRVRTSSVEDFDSFLLKRFQSIPGVDRTQSLVVIHQAHKKT